MKLRRVLLAVAALVVLVGTAPAASGYGLDAARSAAATIAPARTHRPPERDAAAELAALPAFHRPVAVGHGSVRRLGAALTKLRALGAATATPAVGGYVARIDADADARLLRAANTPCCVRGPPAAA